MPVAYLHGVEFLPVEAGVRSISVVRSSVIALTGIAPKGALNSLILVQKSSDLAQFGSELPGFTIPQALKAIFDNQPTQILVVNVFDPETHIEEVANEPVTIALGKAKLVNCPIGALTTIYESDGITPILAVVDEDYTIDDFGNFKVINNTLLPDGNIEITYNIADLSLITPSEIIGDNGDTKTGMQLFRQSFSTFGFKPKQIIVPGFSALTAVSAEMAVCAERYKAMYYIDAPQDTAVSDVYPSRGPVGPIDAFNVGDKRCVLLFPMPTAYDKYSNDNAQVRHYSPFFAGVIAFVDNTEGYHVSPGNHVIKGITGLEKPISWDFTDASGETDANQLNEVGVVTIANGVGTGYLVWGNRSSYFPANTTPDNFIPVQRSRDMTEESIAFAMRPFDSKPISRAEADSVVETVNAFMRLQIGRGALVDGSKCYLDPEENTPENLATGMVVFVLDFMSPTPGERFRFKSFLNTSLLGNILTVAA